MKVPPAERANLYLAAVKYNEDVWDGSRAIYLGVVRDINIPEESIVTIRMADINWVPATWRVSDEDKAIWEGNRIYEAQASERYLKRPTIYVRDPFQVGYHSNAYDDLLIGINGYCSWGGNTDGWRTFVIYAKNTKMGEDHIEQYSFKPYVSSDKFNLPSACYFIPDFARV